MSAAGVERRVGGNERWFDPRERRVLVAAHARLQYTHWLKLSRLQPISC